MDGTILGSTRILADLMYSCMKSSLQQVSLINLPEPRTFPEDIAEFLDKNSSENIKPSPNHSNNTPKL